MLPPGFTILIRIGPRSIVNAPLTGNSPLSGFLGIPFAERLFRRKLKGKENVVDAISFYPDTNHSIGFPALDSGNSLPGDWLL